MQQFPIACDHSSASNVGDSSASNIGDFQVIYDYIHIYTCISNNKGPSELKWTLVMIELKRGKGSRY